MPEAPEQQLARDLVRRAVPLAPLLVVLAGAGWGLPGVLSSAYAMALVLANFLAAATVLAWAARVSPAFLMGAALLGYLLRLAALFAAVYAVRHASWVALVPLGLTLVLAHLGLLLWETRYVSISLAFPALRPRLADPKE